MAESLQCFLLMLAIMHTALSTVNLTQAAVVGDPEFLNEGVSIDVLPLPFQSFAVKS